MPIGDPEYLVEASGPALPLGRQIELAGLGQTIRYPEGWHAESRMPYTNIAEDPADIDRWFGGAAVQGPLVFFEVETVDFIQSVGVDTPDPRPEDLVAFSTEYFDWEDVRGHQRLALFDGEGIQVRARERRGSVLAIQAVLPDERVLLITVVAPTETTLDASLPTWRAMTRSLESSGAAALSTPTGVRRR